MTDTMTETLGPLGAFGVLHLSDPARRFFQFSIPKTDQKTEKPNAGLDLAYQIYFFGPSLTNEYFFMKTSLYCNWNLILTHPKKWNVSCYMAENNFHWAFGGEFDQPNEIEWKFGLLLW